jgi:catechol 2,3-dioxygenase-like lactoylglutathione lyase family enzyme
VGGLEVILGVSHFSFTVSDVDRSTDWYTSNLAFEVVHRQRQDNDYTRELVGVDNAILEVALLQAPGSAGLVLELVQYAYPAANGPQPSPGEVGFAHLSFLVDDIHWQYERLSAAGVRFQSPPVSITAGTNVGGFVCYFADPDDNGLELFQRPEMQPVEPPSSGRTHGV